MGATVHSDYVENNNSYSDMQERDGLQWIGKIFFPPCTYLGDNFHCLLNWPQLYILLLPADVHWWQVLHRCFPDFLNLLASPRRLDPCLLSKYYWRDAFLGRLWRRTKYYAICDESKRISTYTIMVTTLPWRDVSQQI